MKILSVLKPHGHPQGIYPMDDGGWLAITATGPILLYIAFKWTGDFRFVSWDINDNIEYGLYDKMFESPTAPESDKEMGA